MYRLAELSDSRRKLIGATLLLAGLVGLGLGVFVIHWSSFPVCDRIVDGVCEPHVVGFANWFPRGTLWLGLGYLIVLGATSLALIGGAFLWVLNQPMTWTRAMVAATLSWVALVFFFGMVPSEWLNFAQTELDWSSQRVALTIPPVLVLGNDIDISWAVVKDLVNVGYHNVMLVVAAVLALQIQKMKQGRPAAARKPDPVSPYGRPLVRGDR